jgi:hypothetical protein
MTLVVNLYGGPGTGKSTTAAALFAELKQDGYNAELVTEYAKDRVWDNHIDCLNDQLYVLGKQYHRFHRLIGKVDVIVTDAPILLSAYYNRLRKDHDKFPSFEPLVKEVYRSMNNFDVFLRRVKAYNPAGRLQSEDGAKQIDGELKKLLDESFVLYTEYDADREAAIKIRDLVKIRLLCDNLAQQSEIYRQVREAQKLMDEVKKDHQEYQELTYGRNSQ